MNSYVNFTYCPPIVDIQPNGITPHQVNLNWTLTNLTQSGKYYKSITIYRYIGAKDVCTPDTSISPLNTNGSVKTGYTQIRKYTQNFDLSGNPTTITKINAVNIATTINDVLSNILTDTDDLSTYYTNGSNLKNLHGITDATNDSVILDQIYNTTRSLYYIISILIDGLPEIVSSYVLASHTYTGILDAYSNKTQVLHDTLHLEGDMIWSTVFDSAITTRDNDSGLSRTSVDIQGIYRSPAIHAGPNGRGGYGWVSDRAKAHVFRVRLSDGQRCGYWKHSEQSGRGFPIAVNPNTSECYAASYQIADGTNKTYLRVFNSPESSTSSFNAIPHIAYGGTGTLVTNTPILRYSNQDAGAYGMSFISGTNKIAIATRHNYGLSVFNISTKTAGAQLLTSTHNGEYNAYGMTIGPDGSSYAVTTNEAKRLFIITPINGRISVKPTGAADITFYTSVDQISNITYDTTYNTSDNLGLLTCTTDFYNVWPNTSNNVKKYHLIRSGWGKVADLNIDASTKDYITDKHSVFNITDVSSRGVATDDSNSIWAVGTYITKIYRMKDNEVYPTGGGCRYPSVSLNYWSDSSINTREIQWFLTRDPLLMDNVNKVAWYPGKNQTALEAYNGLISDKRFENNVTQNIRVTYSTTSKTCSRRTYDPNTTTGLYYFETYDEATGVKNPESRVYGIRMVDHTNKNLCVQKINAWFNAFANSDNSECYKNISNRDTLIQNNLIGRYLFPAYVFAKTNTLPAIYQTNNFSANAAWTATKFQGSYPGIYNRQLIKNLTYKPGYAIGDTTTKSYEYVIPNYHSWSYEYSDFTGNLIVSKAVSITDTDNIHPNTTPPTISLLVSATHTGGYKDTPAYCYPWNVVVPENTLSNGVTGYDDLSVTYLVSTYPGSYTFKQWSLYTDDYASYLTDTNNELVKTKVNDIETQTQTTFDYTYHSPSKNGIYYLPSGSNEYASFLSNASGRSTGYFTPTAYISAVDIYSSTCAASSFGSTAKICVLERWSEPKFYLAAETDTAKLNETRKTLFACNSSWGASRFDKDVSRLSHATDAKRFDVVYGTDPISLSAQDRSISRTWPISSWTITISNSSNFGAFQSPITREFTGLDVVQDSQDYFTLLSAVDFRYGDYTITMYTQTSTTATSSDRYFTQYVKVSEFEPFANFWAVSAQTVSAYYADTPSTSGLEIINSENAGTTYKKISGYAPNMTVWFQNSSEAHTFPIAEYIWDFGDPYNESTSIVRLSTDPSSVTGTFNNACWRTPLTWHTTAHTYTMPGAYNVTLTVRASNTLTQDICSRYINAPTIADRYYVYVDEHLASCGTGIWASSAVNHSFYSTSAMAITGQTPLTAYFNASGIIAGSFPICRIDWNFGDGTIETITRTPATTATSQGLTLHDLSLYNGHDPRNFVIPHIYTTAAPYHDISLSAYACNTNTMLTCTNNKLISSIVEPVVLSTSNRRLVGNRIDNDGNLLYIFEDQSNNTLFTVALSGEIHE